MIGGIQQTSAVVWLQTDSVSQIEAAAWPLAGGPPVKATARTAAQTGFAVALKLEPLRPGAEYYYQVWQDGQRLLPEFPRTTFSTAPAFADTAAFTFQIGSCALYAPEYRGLRKSRRKQRIFRAMGAREADFMLWLGDNIYTRPGDRRNETTLRARYRRNRGQPEKARFLATRGHFAIWDDHDFGPNDGSGAYPGKALSRKVFREQWPNPRPEPDTLETLTTTFAWGDCAFFLLDDRYLNDRRPESAALAGKAQTDWLLRGLTASQARFKFVAVGLQVFTTVKIGETWQRDAPRELFALVDSIRARQIPGVVFLSGDRHFSELTVYPDETGEHYPLYNLTASALSSPPFWPLLWTINRYRVKGCAFGGNNFAELTVSGPADNRRLKIRVFDRDGALQWAKTISYRELSY